MKVKKRDFLEIEYTGSLEDGTVFDTTDLEKAKKAGIASENSKLGPVVVCIGEGHILKGIEESLIGKELGSHKVKLQPENAFGKKNMKLLKLIPMKVFLKEKINPFPGLEVNIDNMYGIVRTVSGGRVYVDFNHPLSGRVVEYDVKINKEIKDDAEKVKAIFKNELNSPDMKFQVAEKVVMIDEEIPKEAVLAIKKRVLELVPSLVDVKAKSPAKKEKK